MSLEAADQAGHPARSCPDPPQGLARSKPVQGPQGRPMGRPFLAGEALSSTPRRGRPDQRAKSVFVGGPTGDARRAPQRGGEYEGTQRGLSGPKWFIQYPVTALLSTV